MPKRHTAADLDVLESLARSILAWVDKSRDYHGVDQLPEHSAQLPYRAQLWIDGRNVLIGRYATEEERDAALSEAKAKRDAAPRERPKQTRKYRAQIRVDGLVVSLGDYNTIEERDAEQERARFCKAMGLPIK